MALPSTEHYEVIVTKDPEHEGTQCYGVSNKETDVIEYFDNLLPRTFQAMTAMEKEYGNMVDVIEGKAPPELSLVPIDETDVH